jgi:hypothetical protein
VPVQEIFILPCLLCQPSTKYFFPHFTLFVPIAHQPGQTVILGRLSLCMYLLWRQMKSVWRGKRYFVLGRLEQPMQYKSLLYRRDESNEPTWNQPRKDPFHIYSLSPHLPHYSTVSRGHMQRLHIRTPRRAEAKNLRI